MRNCINIKGNGQVFPYIIEYSKNAITSNEDNITNSNDIKWYRENNIIRFFDENIQYYRDKNDWYNKYKCKGFFKTRKWRVCLYV
jgi:hypothetical protein